MGVHQWHHVNPASVFWIAQMCMGPSPVLPGCRLSLGFFFHRLSYYYHVPAARHPSGHWPWIALVVSHPGRTRPPCLACLAPMLKSCTAAPALIQPSARSAAALLGPVTYRSVRRRAQASSTGAASPHGVSGSSARSPPRSRFPHISAARAGPQAGHMRPSQGAVIRESSRRTTSSSWPTTILNGANLLTRRQRRCAVAPEPSHARPHMACALSTPPLTSLFRAFSGAAGGRLDTFGGRPSFWPASADAVPPAAPPPPPPRLRTLVFECVDWPSGQLPTVPGPCIGGLRGW